MARSADGKILGNLDDPSSVVAAINSVDNVPNVLTAALTGIYWELAKIRRLMERKAAQGQPATKTEES